jgi:hypothetical protein
MSAQYQSQELFARWCLSVEDESIAIRAGVGVPPVTVRSGDENEAGRLLTYVCDRLDVARARAQCCAVEQRQ